MVRTSLIILLVTIAFLIILFLYVWYLWTSFLKPNQNLIVKPINYSYSALNSEGKTYDLTKFSYSFSGGLKDQVAKLPKQVKVFRSTPSDSAEKDAKAIASKLKFEGKPRERIGENGIAYFSYSREDGSTLRIGKYNSEIEFSSAKLPQLKSNESLSLNLLESKLKEFGLITPSLKEFQLALLGNDQELHLAKGQEIKSLNATYEIEGLPLFFDSLLGSPIRSEWVPNELTNLYYFYPLKQLSHQIYPLKKLKTVMEELRKGQAALVDVYSLKGGEKEFVDLPAQANIEIQNLELKYYLDRTLFSGIQPIYELKGLVRQGVEADKTLEVILLVPAVPSRFVYPGVSSFKELFSDFLKDLY